METSNAGVSKGEHRRSVKLLVVCHVEAGMIRNREILFDRAHGEGVSTAVPRIVEFAERHKVPVAFAMTPQSLEILETDLERFPRGLHLHPRDPVLARETRGEVGITTDCLRDYPLESQGRLIDVGVRAFVETVGERPRFFVAGNWSENADTLRILEGAGFRLDASPLPGHLSPCADWRRIPRLAQPYRPSLQDYQSEGNASLLYAPVYQGLWGDYLTPETLHLLGVAYFKAALTEAAVGGAGVVHMYFHSPMALDPYFLSEFSHVLDIARDDFHAGFVDPRSLVATTGPTPRPFPPAYLAFLRLPRMKSLFVRRFPAFSPEVSKEGHRGEDSGGASPISPK